MKPGKSTPFTNSTCAEFFGDDLSLNTGLIVTLSRANNILFDVIRTLNHPKAVMHSHQCDETLRGSRPFLNVNIHFLWNFFFED